MSGSRLTLILLMKFLQCNTYSIKCIDIVLIRILSSYTNQIIRAMILTLQLYTLHYQSTFLHVHLQWQFSRFPKSQLIYLMHCIEEGGVSDIEGGGVSDGNEFRDTTGYRVCVCVGGEIRRGMFFRLSSATRTFYCPSVVFGPVCHFRYPRASLYQISCVVHTNGNIYLRWNQPCVLHFPSMTSVSATRCIFN